MKFSCLQITILSLLSLILIGLCGLSAMILVVEAKPRSNKQIASEKLQSETQPSPSVPTSTPLPTRTPFELPTAKPTSTPAPTNTSVVTYGLQEASAANNQVSATNPQPITPPSTNTPVRNITPLYQDAFVTNVVDGDTIDVLIDGMEYRVRYILIDTPETKHPTIGVEPYGEAATQANSRLVGGKWVSLEKDVSETDRYGRLLRYVYVNGAMVNEELVRLGLAQVSTYPPDVKYVDRLREVQKQAQIAGIGIWAPHPTATPSQSYPVIVEENSPNRPILNKPVSQGSQGSTCDCSGNRFNCGDFSSHQAAQSCFEYCKSEGRGDIHRLDGDNDDIACEALP